MLGPGWGFNPTTSHLCSPSVQTLTSRPAAATAERLFGLCTLRRHLARMWPARRPSPHSAPELQEPCAVYVPAAVETAESMAAWPEGSQDSAVAPDGRCHLILLAGTTAKLPASCISEEMTGCRPREGLGSGRRFLQRTLGHQSVSGLAHLFQVRL